MKNRYKCCLLFLAAITAALILRLPLLQQRPMHGDEAVHAVKFGDLMHGGSYRYDAQEYHGPTLNYFTLIPAKLAGVEKYADLNEFILRIVPVFFGVLLIVFLILLIDGLGWAAVIIAAILTAVSPAFVFYSRYYIQEMLLVCFTFGVITCGYRYTKDKKLIWALLSGTFFGLCHATKETCLIVFGSLVLAVLSLLLSKQRKVVLSFFSGIKALHIIVAVAAAVTVSALFYSSFFTNPRGIIDSLLAYKIYFSRAGANQLHIHRWYYYIKMLLFYQYLNGPVFSEAVIVLLAVVGFAAAIKNKIFSGVNIILLRFIAFYTVIELAVYSLIPYKTPWCLLGFLHGMILLAGIGAVVAIKIMPNKLMRKLIVLLLIAATGHLFWQGRAASFKYFDNSKNPYVYAHPFSDVISLAERVEQVAGVHPDKFAMHIQIVCPEHDYWPLPWYLRRFEYGTIDYSDVIDADSPAAPLIILSAEAEPELVKKLYQSTDVEKRELYVSLFNEPVMLRPTIELRCYVQKSLWDKYSQQSNPVAPLTD